MRVPLLAACALLTVAFAGAPRAQTTSPGPGQPPVTAPPQTAPTVRVPITPVTPLRNFTIRQQPIRTSALTMIGGTVATTDATPRNIRTARLAMVGGALATSSVMPRNIRTTPLTMRGAP